MVFNAALLQADDFNYLFELVDLIFALEKNRVGDYKVEDASQCPDIYSFPVVLGSEQQFRSTVEERSDHVGHGLVFIVKFFGHAAIDDLDVIVVSIDVCGLGLRDKVTVFGCEHNVGWFQISVNQVVTMKFLYPSEDLLKNLLDCEFFLTHYYLIEVRREPLHHHHWLIFSHKRVDHFHQMTAIQNLEDVPLPDETYGQANFIQ